MTSSNIRHLIILTGQGDHYVGLATPEQWAWIHSQPPAERDDPHGWTEKDPEGDHPTTVTIGSYDNDRAIAACMGHVYEDGEAPNDERPTFDSTGQARKFAKSQGWEIHDDEYHGYVY